MNFDLKSQLPLGAKVRGGAILPDRGIEYRSGKVGHEEPTLRFQGKLPRTHCAHFVRFELSLSPMNMNSREKGIGNIPRMASDATSMHSKCPRRNTKNEAHPGEFPVGSNLFAQTVFLKAEALEV